MDKDVLSFIGISIFAVILMTLPIFIGEETIKETECYDDRNHEIKELTCISKTRQYDYLIGIGGLVFIFGIIRFTGSIFGKKA